MSATGQFLLATYRQFPCPPTGSFRCPLTVVSFVAASPARATPSEDSTFGPRNSNGMCPDEYGVALDVECIYRWKDGEGGRVAQACLDAFVWEAQEAGLEADVASAVVRFM